jgi:uncharacterized membrane protein SirB2
MNNSETILSWNTANWITVVLMGAIFYTVAGFVVRAIQQRRKAA